MTLVTDDDGAHEPDATLTLTLNDGDAYDLGTPSQAAVEVLDNEGLPRARLEIDPGQTIEEGGAFAFTVILSHASTEEIEVPYTLTEGTGAAAAGVSAHGVLALAGGENVAGPGDAILEGTVVFMPGETRKEEVVSLRRDDRPGSPIAGTIRVALQVSGDGYELDTSPEAEVTAEVTVQEPLAVTLHLSTDTVTEAGGVSTVTASLNRPSNETTSVTVTASPASPTVAGDYALSANRELTIPAGSTTSTGRVTIAAVDNDVDAADRRVTVSATARNSQGVADPAPVTLTIRDDDELTMALDVSPEAVSEGDGETLVTVTATVTGTTRLGEARTVTVTVAGSDEDAAVDFAAVADFEIVVPAGTPGTRSQATFTLTPEDDTVDELDAVLRVSGRAGNATVTDATLTLTDDDEAPTGIALAVSPQTVSEGDGETPVTVTATVTGATRFGVAQTLTVSVAGSGSSGAVGFAAVADFTVTVPAAARSGTGTFVLTPEDDERDEFDETIAVSGRLGDLEIAPARMTVTDNDVLSLSVSDIEVLESAGEAEFTLNLSHESARRIEIGVSFEDVTATRGGGLSAERGAGDLCQRRDAAEAARRPGGRFGDRGERDLHGDVRPRRGRRTVGEVRDMHDHRRGGCRRAPSQVRTRAGGVRGAAGSRRIWSRLSGTGCARRRPDRR